MQQKWPQQIWLVRHGQSAGNVAREEAEAAHDTVIDIAQRDVDVPLSALGERQAQALAGWFAALPVHEQPTVVLHSPYVRAAATAQLIKAGIDPDSLIAAAVDERLREKEFGILDGLTLHGIAQRYPELYRQRQHVGKFYFRPPGGESWCDVILRLRSVLDTITREYAQERVLIVGHQVTVNCLRYLFERLDEATILDYDRRGDVPNCSVTSYRFDPAAGKHGKLVLDQLNFVAPLEAAGTPITVSQDVPIAPKA
ncbi:histidine phosphatase family protein [Massilia sp. DWR3-1-1]|uniref:histidine phosphatase family protein n=1 Tax=Massilia sp. DWR3-1-1 TaxID=2804559 RepID=UPI003CF1DE57